jgi:hypothetical protein
MPARFKDLCLDAGDHQALADWWCAALGYLRRESEDPRPPDWPIRLHFDVTGDKAELLGLGATLVRAGDEDIEWDILADPEGNEFCVFAPQR